MISGWVFLPLVLSFSTTPSWPSMPASTRTFYVDAANGDDANTGVSAQAPWHSLSAVNQVQLSPGDEVRLARGSVWREPLLFVKEGGTAAAPVRVTAYGHGSRPRVTGATQGIHARYADFVVIEAIVIQEIEGAGVYGRGSDGWIFKDVDIVHTGGALERGGFSWWHAEGLVLDGVTVRNTRGDGFYGEHVRTFTVRDCAFDNAHGVRADNLQIHYGANIILERNRFLIAPASDTKKGNVVVEYADGLRVTGSRFAGGRFGIVSKGSKVRIADNVFSGHDREDWSASIIINGDHDLHDVALIGNRIEGSTSGIAIDHPSLRTGLKIANNLITGYTKAAIRVHDSVIEGVVVCNRHSAGDEAPFFHRSGQANIANLAFTANSGSTEKNCGPKPRTADTSKTDERVSSQGRSSQ